MPRPLKILKTIVEEDPSATYDRINELLGETVGVAEEALRHLATCLNVLTNKDRASNADRSIVDLGVRLWNDFRAANLLIRAGLYLQAMMLERDAIEIMVLTEYLHAYPKYAQAWWKAETLRERRHFGINELKDKVKDGKDWKDVWDWLSAYIHPNGRATPVYATSKPFYGHYLYLGGFYHPGSIATFFQIQLSLCIQFLQSFMSWYKDELTFPAELPRKIEMSEDVYHNQIDRLKERARSRQKATDDIIEVTRLSKGEVIKMFKYLDTLP